MKMLEKLRDLIENSDLNELQKDWNSFKSHEFSNGLVLTTKGYFTEMTENFGDVSFDFDSTLSRTDVQKFALRLKQMGYTLHITTTRFADGLNPSIPCNAEDDQSNFDLYDVAMSLGIPHSRIKFTNGDDKEFEIFTSTFKFHLDDCEWEIKEINKKSNIGVHLSGNWEEICLGLCKM